MSRRSILDISDLLAICVTVDLSRQSTESFYISSSYFTDCTLPLCSTVVNFYFYASRLHRVLSCNVFTIQIWKRRMSIWFYFPLSSVLPNSCNASLPRSRAVHGPKVLVLRWYKFSIISNSFLRIYSALLLDLDFKTADLKEGYTDLLKQPEDLL